MHPNCRSTTVPEVEGMDTSKDKRAARNPITGETERVPADWTYEKWYNERVKYFSNAGKTSTNRFTNGSKSGIINISKGSTPKVNISIDAFTPCLVDRKTGEILSTQISEITPKKKDYAGWNFDWSLPQKNGEQVYALRLENDAVIQGMVSLKPDKANNAMYLGLVETAPHNFGHLGKYEGVGAHMFAFAGKTAYEKGFDCVYFEAKTDLISYYRRKIGAITTGFGNRMILEGDKLLELVKYYYPKGAY